jgi:hypothetical protein
VCDVYARTRNINAIEWSHQVKMRVKYIAKSAQSGGIHCKSAQSEGLFGVCVSIHCEVRIPIHYDARMSIRYRDREVTRVGPINL